MNGVLTVYLEHTYSKRREQKGTRGLSTVSYVFIAEKDWMLLALKQQYLSSLNAYFL